MRGISNTKELSRLRWATPRWSTWLQRRRPEPTPDVSAATVLTPEAVLAGLEVDIGEVRHALASVRRVPQYSLSRSKAPFAPV